MTTEVCLTVDVEDWYEGMAVLGQTFDRPEGTRSGLGQLGDTLDSAGGHPAVTFFVVGNYAERVRSELIELAGAGHEIASHGPDHGRLPEQRGALVDWLRSGRTMIEDLVQRPVRGFRSPRFDVPAGMALGEYREVLAEAGFSYVSDTHLQGEGSPLLEIPVLTSFGVPIGGGSYQRLFPLSAVSAGIRSADGPAVLYYHSYDFGATLPSLSSIRSMGAARQLVGRGRIAGMFARILERYGSKACDHVER